MQIETLGDALDNDVSVWMACAFGTREGMKSIPECKFSRELDMETLVCTRGRDFPIARLAERLRCPRCKSRRVRVVWKYPSAPVAGSIARR
jgi:Zn finger protein HypA/HybF involved in hydrogenase expression